MKNSLIIIALTILVLAITVFLARDLYQKSEQVVVSQFNAQQLLIARIAATKIEAYLNDRSQGIQTISTFARLGGFQNLDPKETQETVNSYFERIKTKFVKSVSIYDEEGTIIYSTNKAAVGRNYKTGDFFIRSEKKENTGKVLISSLIRIQEGDKEPLRYFRFILATTLYQEVSLFKWRA